MNGFSVDPGERGRFVRSIHPPADLRFADPASPTLVLDPTDAGVKYVLMPLRV